MKLEPDTEIKRLTVRELFAAMAMQGFCASACSENFPFEAMAILAVKQADALIAELNKEVK